MASEKLCVRFVHAAGPGRYGAEMVFGFQFRKAERDAGFTDLPSEAKRLNMVLAWFKTFLLQLRARPRPKRVNSSWRAKVLSSHDGSLNNVRRGSRALAQ